MANEVRDLAQSIYFTLPESVWNSQNDFFRSFNFSHLYKANVQYRLFDEELECNASFDEVWSAVAAKMPKICSLYAWNDGSLASDLLVSIHPKHVEQIFSGKKRYELRRKFSTKWVGHRMNIYATEPAMQLVGQATVRRVVQNSPREIWKKLGSELGCNRTDFDRYTKNAEKIFALELDEITPFRIPISRKDAAEILKESLTPPQSYCAVKQNKPWGQAVTLATLLQGAFKGQILSPLNKLFAPPKSMIGKGSSVCDFQLSRLLS
jgi:predicted transcriptional regulator